MFVLFFKKKMPGNFGWYKDTSLDDAILLHLSSKIPASL